ETVTTNNISEQQLVTMMVGRDIERLFPQRKGHELADGEEVLLRVEGLTVGQRVKDISFSIRRGEIVGFSGSICAGRTEAMRAIVVADRITRGEIYWKGEKISPKSPRKSIRMGLGLLPEARKTQGLVLQQPIRVNATLVSQKGNGYIDHKAERDRVSELLASVSTRYGSIEDNVESLSGGNQQKVALAKWL